MGPVLPKSALSTQENVKDGSSKKTYGFIKDDETGETVFVHANDLEGRDRLLPKEKVQYEVSVYRGRKNAVNVKSLPEEEEATQKCDSPPKAELTATEGNRWALKVTKERESNLVPPRRNATAWIVKISVLFIAGMLVYYL